MRNKGIFAGAVLIFLSISFIVSGLSFGAAQAQGRVTSPEKFFGFRLGSDKKMARWDKMVEYYNLLEKEGAGRI